MCSKPHWQRTGREREREKLRQRERERERGGGRKEGWKGEKEIY